MRNRGIAEVVLLVWVIAGLFVLFVPNPISKAVGVGVQPNKISHSEKVEFIKDKDGNPIATRTVVTDSDVQQKVGFWEWLRSLPGLVILLMLLGIVFPPISVFLANAKNALMRDTKKIIVGVDRAMDNVTDSNIKKIIYDEMAKVQDTSTKSLVDKVQGKK